MPDDLLDAVLTAHGGLDRWRATASLSATSTTTPAERVELHAADGTLLDARDDPRPSFPLPFDRFATRWDPVQIAYFQATANWNYLTEPWQFADPGTITREIAPWEEDGETWRRLAVTFAPGNANHNPDQVFYYGEDLMLRRMDYRPDVTGGSPIAHYASDPITVDGLVFPTRRRVHLHDADGVADRGLAVIEIDVMTMTTEGTAA